MVESSLENRNVGAVLLAMRLILALGVALLARCDFLEAFFVFRLSFLLSDALNSALL
jgi:hypothetical protein